MLVVPRALRAQVVGFFMENNNKYKLKEAFSQEAVKAFVAGVLDGTAEVRGARDAGGGSRSAIMGRVRSNTPARHTCAVRRRTSRALPSPRTTRTAT